MIIWPPMYVESLLGRGEWEDYAGNHDVRYILNHVHDTRNAFRKSNGPNLFSFATSELSQDAFLCWLFEHLKKDNHGVTNKVAKHLLDTIVDKYTQLNPNQNHTNLRSYTLKSIKQQVYNIDILLTFESDIQSEKLYMIIEDKVSSGESRENQPEYYADKLKIKDSNAQVISVLFKTGYASQKERKDFERRKIVFIGNEEIYDVFSSYGLEMKDNVILNSWCVQFCERNYIPIHRANLLQINPTTTLKSYSIISRKFKLPESIVFNKLTDFLFSTISSGFQIKRFSFQGKGHVDWHFELTKENWSSKEKNISISIYFIWDTFDFSLVIKSSPFTYKPLKKLTDSEKKEYMATRDTLKLELKKNSSFNWKLTNYYLQIAQMENIQKITLDSLKDKIIEDVSFISSEIDHLMMNM
ncbi:hypothetical protein ACLM5H_17075 [Fredinandcohnia humi]